MDLDEFRNRARRGIDPEAEKRKVEETKRQADRKAALDRVREAQAKGHIVIPASQVRVEVDCGECDGVGVIGVDMCSWCNGSGTLAVFEDPKAKAVFGIDLAIPFEALREQMDEDEKADPPKAKCDSCSGLGKIRSHDWVLGDSLVDCPICSGSGFVMAGSDASDIAAASGRVLDKRNADFLNDACDKCNGVGKVWGKLPSSPAECLIDCGACSGSGYASGVAPEIEFVEFVEKGPAVKPVLVSSFDDLFNAFETTQTGSIEIEDLEKDDSPKFICDDCDGAGEVNKKYAWGANGKMVSLTFANYRPCETCSGTGFSQECKSCNGVGSVIDCDAMPETLVDCAACAGLGFWT